MGDLTFPLSGDYPFRSFGQGHDVRIQHHQHRLWYSLEKIACLHGQPHVVRNRRDLAIAGQLAVAFQ